MHSCFRYVFLSLLISSVIVALLTNGQANASITLTPGVSVRAEYDDNLFLNNENEIDDLSMTVVPRFSLLLENKYITSNINYSLEFVKYLDETYLDEDEIKDIQRADISGVILPENRISVLYEGSIDRVIVDDRRSETSNIVNVTNEYRGIVRPRYQYRLAPNITGELAYQYETIRYDTPDNVVDSVTELDDVEDHDAFFQIVLAYSQNLNLQLETYYNWHESDLYPDYEMWHGIAGFVWRPLSHFSMEVNAGGAVTDVEEGHDNLTDTLYRVLLEYRPPQKWGFFTSYIKDLESSAEDGRYKWWEVAGGMVHQGRLTFEARVYTREESYQFIDREDDIYGIDTTFEYDLKSQLTAEIFGSYSRRKYRPDAENVNRYRAGCGLVRRYERASIALRYAFVDNDSDIDSNSYTSNIVSLDYSMDF